MPLLIDNIPISSVSVGRYLKAQKLIGDLELRQASFFSSRLPDENSREDFHLLLLLLLACLCKGYPGAREEDMAGCLGNHENSNGLMPETIEEGEFPQFRGDPHAIYQSFKTWFGRVTEDNFIRRLAPLAATGLNMENSPQPLVIYDKLHGVFSFQAYYASENLLSKEFPRMLQSGRTDPDIARVRSATMNALRLSFPERKAHVRQALACILSIINKFLIISGGPGTGKSTVVHLVIRAVCEYHDIPLDAVMLCAPTGRAKARLLEAVTRDLPPGDAFISVQARTIHSLLGTGENGKPVYSKAKRLPFRLIVIDEVSMVDMRLFAQLIEALSDDCRLVLVGDMNQLPPVDAGAVLGDLTSGLGRNDLKPSLSAQCIKTAAQIISGIEQVEGAEDLGSAQTDSGNIMTDHVVFLTRNYRCDLSIMQWWNMRLNGNSEPKDQSRSGAIEHVKAGDIKRAKGIETVLSERFGAWINLFVDEVYKPWKSGLRMELIINKMENGPVLAEKLRNMIEKRIVLCCVHEGSMGRIRANAICDFLFRKHKGEDLVRKWHDGQPVIINRNQSGGMELYNGDLGIILEVRGAFYGCFPVRGGVLKIPVERISDLDQAYAISVHKSQGSEFTNVMLLVPDNPAVPITRQLVYTGITRAKTSLCIVDPQNRLANAGSLPDDERYSLLREILN